MPGQEKNATVAVSFRLDRTLVKRMRDVSNARPRRQTDDRWPPPPTQTEIVERGIEMVLDKLERERRNG